MDTLLRLRNAVQATEAMVLPGHEKSYWEETLASRQPNGFGSRFLIETSKEELLSWNWVPYPECPNLMDGCTALRCDQPGILGIVRLSDLHQETEVTLCDPKSTGKVTPEIERSALFGGLDRVDFTVLILGMEGDREVVFTFHPGDPIRPSQVPSDLAGSRISVTEALNLGLEFAKIQG